MRLISLELNNFRQYYENQYIEFSENNEKNITIILGQNGEGKTGIFRAVVFCLFGQIFLSGEEKVSRNNRNKNGDFVHLVNFNKLKEDQDEPVEAYVKVKFEHEGQKYEIKRSLVEMMEQDGNIFSDDITNVEMILTSIDGNTSSDKITDDDEIQAILSNILDKKLKDFFLFDGEKIESLSKPNKETRAEVKSGIIKLLQIDSVIDAIDILKKLERRQQDKINKNTGNTRLIAKRRELDEEEKKKNNCIATKDKLENEIIECKELISDYERKLSENQEIKKLYEDKAEKENKRSDKKKLVQTYNESAKKLIKLQGSNLILEDYIISIKNFVEQDNISKEYSVKISLELIEELLESKICICGDIIEESSDRYYNLKELKDKYKKSELTNFINIFKLKINEFYDKRQDYEIEVRDLLRNIEDEYDEINYLNIEINKIDEKIKDYSQSEENLKSIEISLRNSREKKDEKKLRIISIEREIEQIEKNIKDINKEIDREEKQETALRNDKKKKDHLVTLRQNFESILDNYSTDMRIKISSEATEIFKKLISIKDRNMVKSIDINDNYEIKVSGWNDNAITSDISAGQRQIISLSFVIALAKVASGSQNKMDVPLFMDTPFGRISGENRDNLINNIPNLTKQWVLLMTDTEFTRAEERVFKDTGRINNVYRLNKIRDGYTKIEKLEDINNISIARR